MFRSFSALRRSRSADEVNQQDDLRPSWFSRFRVRLSKPSSLSSRDPNASKVLAPSTPTAIIEDHAALETQTLASRSPESPSVAPISQDTSQSNPADHAAVGPHVVSHTAQGESAPQSSAGNTFKNFKDAAKAISKLALKVAGEVGEEVPYLKVAVNLTQAAFEIYEVRYSSHCLCTLIKPQTDIFLQPRRNRVVQERRHCAATSYARRSSRDVCRFKKKSRAAC